MYVFVYLRNICNTVLKFLKKFSGLIDFEVCVVSACWCLARHSFQREITSSLLALEDQSILTFVVLVLNLAYICFILVNTRMSNNDEQLDAYWHLDHY